MSEAEVEEILGPPEEIVAFDSDKHLYYDSLGIFLFFGEDQVGSLSGIEVNAHCHCTLAGEDLFPRRRDQAICLLRSISGSSGDAVVIYLEDEGQSRIKLESLAADFYFSQDGSLTSVNWSEMG
jgi:hypothetical protein